MKIVYIFLFLVGMVGILGFFIMYGDIGWAAGIGGVTAIISAIGFIIQDRINKQ